MPVRLPLYHLCLKIVSFIVFLSIGVQTSIAQHIYSKAYGQKKNPAIVYMHGGPRGNATLFEGTTAAILARQGFYVIVYDRRGEGRSADPDAKLTFNEAFDDLNSLIKQYGLKKVNLLGHSFGGIVATLYANEFPQKVDRLILAGALFAQQESYDHILDTSSKIAADKKDTVIISKISDIKSLNKQSAQYRKQTYEVASHFGFFKMPFPSEESKSVNKEYENGAFSKANIRNDQAPILFYKNESRVNIDTKPVLSEILRKGVSISAIYGLQDGIFSKKQLFDMKNLVGAGNFYPIENCSHYPFVDQRSEFLQILGKAMGK
jgi:proline iminopeptidase